MVQDICKTVAFTRLTTGYHGSLVARALSVAGAEIRGSRTVEVEPPRMHREGALFPRASTHSTEPSTDQCIFLKRCKLNWRGVFKKIVAGAGYDQISRDKDGREGAGGGGVVVDEEEEDEENLLSYFANEVGSTMHVGRH